MSVDPAATRRLIESLSTHLEDHLATWKSGLVDARRDIEALLAALSDRIPAQAKPLFPEDVVALMLEDAAPPPAPAAAAPPAPAVPAQADWTVVRGALAAVESARTQVDVLSRFLAQTQAHASRVALLVLRNDRLTGWKAVGYDATGGRDESVRSVDLAGEEDAFVAAVLKGQRSMVAEPPDELSPLRRALGGPAPARSVLVPMVIRDRLAGLVCADELPGEEGRLNEAAIEVLTFVTGLAVDLLAARKKIPSPTLTPTGEKIARFETAPAGATVRTAVPPDLDLLSMTPPAPPPPPASPAGATVAAPVPPPPPRPRATDARQALRAIEESGKRPLSSLHTFSDPGLTSQIPSLGAPPPPPPPPAPPPAAPAPSAAGSMSFPSITPPPAVAPAPAPSGIPSPLSGASTGDFTGAFEALRASSAAMRSTAPGADDVTVQKTAPRTGASAVLPPKEITGSPRPISGFVPRGRAGIADGPQRALDDARRLARLLISEIKLYNEKKVDEGRAAGDLYERLKDDIERSRQVYNERTPEHIRRESDFFRDELVRILADGRTEALGTMG